MPDGGGAPIQDRLKVASPDGITRTPASTDDGKSKIHDRPPIASARLSATELQPSLLKSATGYVLIGDNKLPALDSRTIL